MWFSDVMGRCKIVFVGDYTWQNVVKQWKQCEIWKFIECVAHRPQYKMSDVDNLETHFATT